MIEIERAALKLTCCADTAAWTALMNDREDFSHAMGKALLKFIPFVPVLDNLTDAACAFTARYPVVAIDLWASLLVFEHPHTNTSELRNWVLHVLNLTGVAFMPLEPSQVQTLLQACATATSTTRRRHIANRIHAFQATLTEAFQCEPVVADSKSSDVLTYLDNLAMNVGSHATKSLAWAVDFTKRRWATEWKSDPQVVHRIKLLASMHPELFQAMLEHWVGLDIISLRECDLVFRHSIEFEAILGSVTGHPVVLHRLTTSTVYWHTQCANGDACYIQATHPTTTPLIGPFANVWSSPVLLELDIVDTLLVELDVALKHCPLYAFAAVLLSLWNLLAHLNQHYERYASQLAVATRLFFVSTLAPVACKLESEKLFVGVALVVESCWARWPMWTPRLTKRAVDFVSNVLPDCPTNEAKWAAAMILKHFIIDSSTLQHVRRSLLPPEVLVILQHRTTAPAPPLPSMHIADGDTSDDDSFPEA
ncbi:hypothetical protein DYB31_002393 [Aphanomyces astaci]|uniref:Uncharacterized protein n=1 Tax=Aphanomyces astaci TaxID=112090 RepID=A0A397EZF5_APHAT|nr:hypothetical protein DYB31_002393 [Aphanomyces astaci]